MNPNSIYQLYQAQRTRTRAEILADDARRAAAVSRGSHGRARKARASVTMALSAIAARAPKIRTA